MSLKILEYPECAPEPGTEDRMVPGALVQDFGTHARMCGPYQAGDWARARGLDIYYVDNCWIYVTVEKGDLEVFLANLLKGQTSLDPNVLAGAKYLLMAEEF